MSKMRDAAGALNFIVKTLHKLKLLGDNRVLFLGSFYYRWKP